MCSNYNVFDSDNNTDTNGDISDCDVGVVDDNDENSLLDSDSSDLLPIRRRHVRPISNSDDEESETSTNNTQDWVCADIDNNATIHRFSGLPGINQQVWERLGNENTNVDILYEILSDDFWQMLASETNRYQQQTIEDEEYCNKKFDDKWENTNSDEIKAFFALCIITSQVKKSTIESYWSQRGSIETPIFRKTMPLSRFVLLSPYLHFANNDDANRTDRLHKIRSVIEYLNTKFSEIYTPQENVAIDESLMKFKGRLSYVQYNPLKRARFGIKFYKLCESNSGFCSKFKIYTGQDTLPTTNTSASENVVMELVKFIMNKGYTLYMDNWYSSPQLYNNLHAKNINVVGTVLPNRKNMPKELLSRKLKKGQLECRSARELLAVKWKDKKMFISFPPSTTM